MSMQKQIRWKSKKYLKWILTLPCVDCKKEGWEDNQIVPHHIHGIGNLSGIGQKAGDEWAMPMHVTCHTYFHQHPDHKSQWEWIAGTQAKAIVAIANGELKL